MLAPGSMTVSFLLNTFKKAQNKVRPRAAARDSFARNLVPVEPLDSRVPAIAGAPSPGHGSRPAVPHRRQRGGDVHAVCFGRR